MRPFLVIAVLAGLTWLFVVQKQQGTAEAVSNSKAAPERSASPRAVSEHNWMKNSLDRANEVKRQVAQQRKADGTK